MNICFVTTEFVTEDTFHGGLANYLAKVAPYLVERGNAVTIFVAGSRNAIETYRGVEVIVEDFSDIWSAKRKLSVRCLWQAWRIRKRLIGLNATRDFDLIQYSSYRATGLLRLITTKSIVRISSYEKLIREIISPGEPVTRDMLTKERLELFAMKIATAVFAPSELAANRVSENIRKKVSRIRTPFVKTISEEDWDTSVFEESIQDRSYVLYFGKISEVKGMRLVGEKIFELLDSDLSLNLVLIGSDQDWVEQIKESAGEHSERVVSLAQLEHSQLCPIIKAANIVLLPSLIDNYPNACLEAMSLGKIVVGAAGASYEEIIQDGTNGILFKAGDSQSMLENLIAALNLSKEQRNVIEKNAADTAVAHDIGILGQELIDYYEKVIR